MIQSRYRRQTPHTQKPTTIQNSIQRFSMQPMIPYWRELLSSAAYCKAEIISLTRLGALLSVPFAGWLVEVKKRSMSMGWRRVMSNLNRLRDEWNMIHEKRFALVYMHFVSACLCVCTYTLSIACNDQLCRIDRNLGIMTIAYQRRACLPKAQMNQTPTNAIITP